MVLICLKNVCIHIHTKDWKKINQPFYSDYLGVTNLSMILIFLFIRFYIHQIFYKIYAIFIMK